MTAEAELQDSKITGKAEYLPGTNRIESSSLYIVPFFALVSTFVCTSGWRTGLRATLLGGGLLAGIMLTRRLCSVDAKWKKRLAYFIPAGVLGGLLSALVIIALEYFIGSPSPVKNPYHQSSGNLLWICPLYGFFIFLCYSLAFNLSRTWRLLIVTAGAALANNFCLIDLAANPDIQEFASGILRNLGRYYIACLGNSFFYIFMFNLCADGIYRKPMKRIGVVWMLAGIGAAIFAVYFGYIFIGAMTLSIKPDRFIKEHKDTVFKDKLQGVIILGRNNEYFDCRKRKLIESSPFPEKFKQSSDQEKLEKELRKQVNFDKYWNYQIRGKTVYYIDKGKLFRFSPPYERPELLINDFYVGNFCISPDGKFIAYSKPMNMLEYRVFCIRNLNSGKVLAVKGAGYISKETYWLSDDEKEKFIQENKSAND
jgi:hypothetical protein